MVCNGIFWQQHLVLYTIVVHTERSYESELWRSVTMCIESNTLCVRVMLCTLNVLKKLNFVSL